MRIVYAQMRGCEVCHVEATLDEKVWKKSPGKKLPHIEFIESRATE